VTGPPDQVRSDAVSVLRDVLRWSLTPARWADIGGILDRLGTGLDLADPGQRTGLDKATVALELAGPDLLTAIVAETGPAPDDVRDRVNELIHELEPPRRPGADEVAGTAR
jgi:hypothetical protein